MENEHRIDVKNGGNWREKKGGTKRNGRDSDRERCRVLCVKSIFSYIDIMKAQRFNRAAIER